ncbi:SGNH hydrolase-type esterase domain-containing protein [Chlamydoabsidia padenii]|nr:SGNH hydrolase-type esterase domain-containing protein [Chlamydoabsidia padenii]
MSFDPSLFGFGASLASAYQRKIDVLNRGFSGYNTEWALPIFRQLLPKKTDQHNQAARIELMTIFFGANDAALPISFQHIPLTRFKTNLETMISAVKDSNSPYYNPNLRLLLITQPPLNEPQWKKTCDDNGGPLNRTAESAKTYASMVKTVGQEQGIVVVDLWSKVMEQAAAQPNGLEHFLFDGLHLNSNGYKVSKNKVGGGGE